MEGGMTSTPMEIPGGGGLKQNCCPWWGWEVNIFWDCIFYKYDWYILKSYTHVVLPLPVGPSIAFSPGCMIPLQHKNQTNWVLLVVVSQEGEDLIKVVLCSSDLLSWKLHCMVSSKQLKLAWYQGFTLSTITIYELPLCSTCKYIFISYIFCQTYLINSKSLSGKRKLILHPAWINYLIITPVTIFLIEEINCTQKCQYFI